MDTRSWEKLALCPLCKNKFRIGRLRHHINCHKDITTEQELLIRNAAIASLRKSYTEAKLESDRQSVQIRNVNATDVLNGKKHLRYSGKTVSGGAFGQGKKG